MTRRSPRTGESSHERPRPARKERDTLGGTSHRAATMLVHFRETPYGLAMSLVETRRENGRICHEHVASLGSIETPPSVAAALSSGAGCTSGWPSSPTGLTPRRGARSWWRCTLGSQ